MSSLNRASTRLRAGLALLVTASVVALFGLAAPTEAATGSTHSSARSSHAASGMLKLRGTTTDGRHFLGTFQPTSFEVVGGALMATGNVTGRLVGKGRPVPVSSQQVTAQVLSANGTSLVSNSPAVAHTVTSGATATNAAYVQTAAACPILNLKLGPLDLDVLGLQVHVDQVVLDIVAQSGAGNLLGNLLCAVAGLLDGGTPLSQLLGQLSTLLNQILGALGGLPV